MRFLLNWLVNSIAIAVAAAIVPGIAPFGADPWVAYAIAGLFLGIVNGTIKPILSLLSIPLTIVTLGIFQLVVNSFMLSIAGWLSLNLFGAGIAIMGFGSAFVGAIIVSIMCSLLGFITGD